jgi:GABA(A) receptor-associated protein
MTLTAFQSKYTFETRINEASKILEKYPLRIPVIVEKDKGSTLPDLDQFKFVVPKSLTIGEFIYVIRKRIKINPNEAIFLFFNNSILPVCSDNIGLIYDQNKNEDNFLYATISAENAFGSL